LIPNLYLLFISDLGLSMANATMMVRTSATLGMPVMDARIIKRGCGNDEPMPCVWRYNVALDRYSDISEKATSQVVLDDS
jgi:hypothetical protein